MAKRRKATAPAKTTEEPKPAEPSVEPPANDQPDPIADMDRDELAEMVGELQGEMEAQAAEHAQEMRSKTRELADETLVARVESLTATLHDRDRIIKELSAQAEMTRERFQQVAKQNPGWIPQSTARVTVNRYLQDLSDLLDNLKAHHKAIEEDCIKPAESLKQDLRVGGIR